MQDSLKQSGVEAIIDAFTQWAATTPIRTVCGPCCNACCTRNVTATAIEAERILDSILEQKRSRRFARTLGAALSDQPAAPVPARTTNEFAAACLARREFTDEPEERSTAACPFLADSLCSIYEVRPFACRLFVSSVTCSSDQPAVAPEFYFEAATAAGQLIEHLGQQQFDAEFPGEIRRAQLRVRAAQPLPGFLVSDESRTRVQQLLNAIFATTVDGRRLEDLLNGRYVQ